jgi:hypothetical protein
MHLPNTAGSESHFSDCERITGKPGANCRNQAIALIEGLDCYRDFWPIESGKPGLWESKDVNRLVQFYEPALAHKAQRTGEDYAEFPTGVGVLAIFSEDAQEQS